MKYLVTILFFFCASISFAQLQLPELSPVGKIYQKVGYSEFAVQYGRPAARERKIMGDLVPFKKLWRTGAGKCTTISFNDDVFINDVKIPAGIYAILTIPDEEEWTVLLNSDTSKLYGDPSEYDVKSEAMRFKVTREKSNQFYESLTLGLDIVHNDALFYLAWENTKIQFLITTRSHQKAVAEIEKALKENPNDPELLSTAAFYYFMNNESPEQVLLWLNKALLLREDRWYFHQKVDILEKIKNYDEARKVAKTAIGFLARTRPVEWEDSVRNYEQRMKSWPMK